MIICPLPCVNGCQFELRELVDEAYSGERRPYFRYESVTS